MCFVVREKLAGSAAPEFFEFFGEFPGYAELPSCHDVRAGFERFREATWGFKTMVVSARSAAACNSRSRCPPLTGTNPATKKSWLANPEPTSAVRIGGAPGMSV